LKRRYHETDNDCPCLEHNCFSVLDDPAGNIIECTGDVFNRYKIPVLRAYGPGGPASADLVITETENTIYRSCGIAITTRSERKALAKEFADFVQSAEGREIFKRWGWIAP
jgi:accessory colonization factor AcfC